jgi:hypothetical protein
VLLLSPREYGTGADAEGLIGALQAGRRDPFFKRHCGRLRQRATHRRRSCATSIRCYGAGDGPLNSTAKHALAGLAHRPATAIADELATSKSDPWSVALWRDHVERALLAAKSLRAGRPAPRLDMRDPMALRAPVRRIWLVTLRCGRQRSDCFGRMHQPGIPRESVQRLRSLLPPPVALSGEGTTAAGLAASRAARPCRRMAPAARRRPRRPCPTIRRGRPADVAHPQRRAVAVGEDDVDTFWPRPSITTAARESASPRDPHGRSLLRTNWASWDPADTPAPPERSHSGSAFRPSADSWHPSRRPLG